MYFYFKIYEGDGLPDKICSECIQKLSSAHIFKQQCERSDQELRRNFVPPPGKYNCFYLYYVHLLALYLFAPF